MYIPGKGPSWGQCAQPGWVSLPDKERQEGLIEL